MLLDPTIWRQFSVVIIVNLACVSTGWGIAWTSPVLFKLSNDTQDVLDSPLTDEEGSWVVSIGSISGVPVPLVAGLLADLIGRKMLLTAILLPKIISWALIYAATNVQYLYIGRALLGVIDSITFTIVPMFVAELSTKERRGSLGTLLQISCTLSIVAMMCFGPFLSYHVLAVVGLVLTVAALTIVFVPESPYHLLRKGRKDDALAALTFIRGSESLAVEEMKQIESEKVPTTDTKCTQLFATTASIKGLSLAITLAVFTQITGFNAVTMYLQTVFESTGTKISSSVSSAVIGLTQLFASILTTLIADKCGRKSILCTSCAVMGVGMFGLGLFFKLRDVGHPIEGILQYLPLISIILVVFSYSAGFGSLMWPVMTELFPEELRSIGASITTTVLMISLFLTTKFFAQLIDTFGAHYSYWCFAINNAVIFFIVLYLMPETKGRSNAEIQALLQNKLIQL